MFWNNFKKKKPKKDGWTLEPPKKSCTLSGLYADTKSSKKKISNRFRRL